MAPSASAIVGGTPDTTRTYVVFVGQLIPGKTPPQGLACTGVLVAPTIVVTAAHCGLLPNGTAPAGQPFLIFQGPQVGVAPVSPGTFFPDPEFSGGDHGVPHFATHDLAVIRLAVPLPGPYAQLPALGFVDSLGSNTQVTISGYGISEVHGNEPVKTSFGTRRSADAKLAGAGTLGDEFVKVNGPLCEGDSGGPVLLGDVALAINSFMPSTCRSTEYSTRLDTPSARAFLAQFGV